MRRRRSTDSEWTDADRDAFGQTCIDQIAAYSPGFKDRILHVEVRTPRELEAEVGLTEGNIFQGELTFDQLLFNRPVPGYAQYRSPIKDLWMCGSSTHPGGGVMGAPGRNAAAEILREAEGARRDERCLCRPLMSIVIGGGANGLACAARLAGSGRRVTLVEAGETVGGGAGVREVAPGFFAACPCAQHARHRCARDGGHGPCAPRTGLPRASGRRRPCRADGDHLTVQGGKTDRPGCGGLRGAAPQAVGFRRRARPVPHDDAAAPRRRAGNQWGRLARHGLGVRALGRSGFPRISADDPDQRRMTWPRMS